MPQKVIFTSDPAGELAAAIEALRPASVAVIADANTARLALPLLFRDCPALARAEVITIPAGDDNKTIATASEVWARLSAAGCTRSSVVVNVGGGVVTDLGGFAAATFKRGVPFINVPTTLLAAVDAAVGGKTGVNHCGLKNEVGAFAEASSVIISDAFLPSLPLTELLAGYAEMLKHALLIGPEALSRHLAFDITSPDLAALLTMVRESVELKSRIVASDPLDRGPRHALNLGHTAGHAFESHAMSSGCGVPHGVAVAWGLVTELVLSHMLLGFPSAPLHALAAYIKERYPAPAFTCDDYPALLRLMASDKKNATATHINFTLLRAPGQPHLDNLLPLAAAPAARARASEPSAPSEHLNPTHTAAHDNTRDLLH